MHKRKNNYDDDRYVDYSESSGENNNSNGYGHRSGRSSDAGGRQEDEDIFKRLDSSFFTDDDEGKEKKRKKKKPDKKGKKKAGVAIASIISVVVVIAVAFVGLLHMGILSLPFIGGDDNPKSSVETPLQTVVTPDGLQLELDSQRDAYVVVGYLGTKTKVSVPEEYNGKGIIGIKKSAFFGNILVTEIVLPHTIETVEEQAFSGCSALRTLSYADEAKSKYNFQNWGYSGKTNLVAYHSDHKFDREIAGVKYLRSPATCKEKATYYKACICGEIATDDYFSDESGSYGDHADLEHKEAQEASCLETGYTAGDFCKSCGNWVSGHEMIPQAEHQFELSETHTLSCTTDEEKIYYCSVCGEDKVELITKAPGHSMLWTEKSKISVDSSVCLYDVYYTGICSVCKESAIKTETKEVHTFYTVIEKTATCITSGMKNTYCCNPYCKYSTKIYSTEAYTDSQGHKWKTIVSGTVQKEQCDYCNLKRQTYDSAGADNVSISKDDFDGSDIIRLQQASISFDSSVKTSMGNNDVSVSAKVLTEQQKEAIKGELPLEVITRLGDSEIYDFSLISNETAVTNLGGYATIQIPYEPKTGEDVNNIVVWYLNSEGVLEPIGAVYSNHLVTFQTNHFSKYFSGEMTPEEACDFYGHASNVLVVEPTCMSGGYTLCMRCNQIISGTETEPIEHIFSTTVETPTCKTKGRTTYTCTECEYTYSVLSAKTKHDYVLVRQDEVSCGETGKKYYQCSYCEKEKSETYIGLHRYVKTVVLPTCDEKGYTEQRCSLCTSVFYTDLVNAKGHSFGTEWYSDQYGHYHVCSDCLQSDEAQSHIPNYSEATTEHGIQCTACHYLMTPAINHTHSGMTYVGAKEATCLEVGNTSYYICSCGKWFGNADGTGEIVNHTSVYTSTKEHTVVTVERKAPSCKEIGNNAGTKCSVCQTILSGCEEIAKVSHVYTSRIVKANCTEEGYTLYSCTQCGDSYQDNFISALEHDFVEEIIAPTCTVVGKTVRICTVCKEEEDVAGTQKDALGHKYEKWEANQTSHWKICVRCKETTNTETHTKDYLNATTEHGITCTVCEYEIEGRIHEHTTINKVNATEPGCVTFGNKEYFVCEGCDAWFWDDEGKNRITDRREAILPPDGHDPEYVAEVLSSCIEHGYAEGYQCKTCKEWISGHELLPFADHIYVEIVDADYLVSEKDFDHYAVYSKSCSVCGEKHATETFEDVDGGYALRPITLIAESKEKVYDATPLTCSEYKRGTIFQLAEDHTVTVTFSALSTITSVGETDNVIDSVTIQDKNGHDVTDRYEITLEVGKLTVTPAMVEVDWEAEESYIYQGTPYSQPTATIEGVGTDGTITLTVIEKDGKIFKNADNYTFIATNNNINYTLKADSDEKEITIAPYEATVDWTVDATYTYTGSTQTMPTATITGVSTDGTISLTVAEEDGKTFKNADSYTFIATTDNTNYTLTEDGKEIEIAPYEIDVVWTANATYTYTGSVQTAPMAQFIGLGTDGIITLTVAEEDGKTFKNADNYTFIATNDNTNYTLNADSKEIEIDPYEIDAVWTANAIYTYNGNTQTAPTAKFTGLGADGIITLTVTEKNGKIFKNAGIYTFVATNSNTNYTLKADSTQKAVTMGAYELATMWTANAPYTYTGSVQTAPTAKFTGLGTDGVKNLTVTEKDGKVFKNADSYTFIATTGDTNYILKADTTQKVITIGAYELATMWTANAPYTYTGSVQTAPMAKFTGLGADGTITLTVTEKDGKAFKNAGSYTFVATNSNTNYTLKADTTQKTVTIGAYEATVVWTANATYTYTGSTQTAPTAKFIGLGTDGTITLTVTEKDGKTFKNAGNYTFVATNNNTNYTLKADTTQKTVTIGAYEATVVWTASATYTYTGSVQTKPTAKITGVGSEGIINLTVTEKDGKVFKEVGNYTFVATVANTNYTITGTEKTVTIGKIIVAEPSVRAKIYTGVKQVATIATDSRYMVTDNKGGTAVGRYLVEITLNDPTHYQWKTTSAEKVMVYFDIIKNDVYTVIGDTVYMGEYPQTEVKDSTLIMQLNTLAGATTTWTFFDDYADEEPVEIVRYKDVTSDGQKYRGIYIEKYRPFDTSATDGQRAYSYQDDNGYTEKTIYWFSFDPISWTILDRSVEDQTAFVVCDFILDSQAFQNELVEDEGEYYNSEDNYANNWEDSWVRYWLSEMFFETAFDSEQQALVLITEVNNAISGNDYACDNTEDKVFLLSNEEVTDGKYGFSATANDSAKKKFATDYAKAQGVQTSENGDVWALRSPMATKGNLVYYVKDGSLGGTQVNYTCVGIVPAMTMLLQYNGGVVADRETIYEGQTITFTVQVTGYTPVKSLAIAPNFDADLFEVVDAEWLIADAIVETIDMVTLKSVAAWRTEVNPNTAVFKFTLRAKRTTSEIDVEADIMAQRDGSEDKSPVTVDPCPIVVIPCPGHEAGEWVVDVEPTFETTGLRRKYCTICDKIMEEEVVPCLQAKLTADKAEIAVGESVTVTVEMKGVDSTKALSFKPVYDADLFTLTNIEWEISGATVQGFDLTNQTAVAAWRTATDVNKVILKFTLRAKKTSAEAEISSEISIQVGDTEEKHNCTIEKMSIAICE